MARLPLDGVVAVCGYNHTRFNCLPEVSAAKLPGRRNEDGMPSHGFGYNYAVERKPSYEKLAGRSVLSILPMHPADFPKADAVGIR